MLPPQSTRPTLRPRKRSGCFSSAASGAAPAPSTTVFSISSSSTIACSMSPSSTSRMSATCARDDRARELPGSFTAMPSAMVEAANCGSVPFIAWYIAGKRTTSTPTTSIEGFIALAAIAMPGDEPAAADRDHQRVELRDAAASISRPLVPCPAMIFASSYGCTKVRPRSPPCCDGAAPWRRRSSRPRGSPRRRACACARPSRTACSAASRSSPGCRGGARGRPRPARGCPPSTRSRPSRAARRERERACSARRAP